MSKETDHVIRARHEHHEALKAMLPADSTMTGLQAWRKLRYYENKASRLALQLCNGPEISKDEQEKIKDQVREGVRKIFGYLPAGFFINLDPRGFALKLEPGSVPYRLHQDWGRYQILAPTID